MIEERGISSTQHTRQEGTTKTEIRWRDIANHTEGKGWMVGLVDVVVVRKEKRERLRKLEGSVSEFGYDVRHLVDVDELDPGFEIFIVVLPDELGVG